MNLAKDLIDSFDATPPYLYSVKILEKLYISDVFRGYRKRSVAWNGLK